MDKSKPVQYEISLYAAYTSPRIMYRSPHTYRVYRVHRISGCHLKIMFAVVNTKSPIRFVDYPTFPSSRRVDHNQFPDLVDSIQADMDAVAKAAMEMFDSPNKQTH